MAEQTYAGKPSSFYSTTGGKPVEGAWYSGQRYLNGQLLAPGEYEPGKMVSNEVIAQTNPSNVAYIQQKQQQTKTPTSKEGVTPFLNNYQSNLFNTSTAPATRIPTADQLKTELTPEGGRPAPINRLSTFQQLRNDQGVADLENQLNDLKAQEDQVNAQFVRDRTAERGKTVPMGVINGRISKEAQPAQEQLDFIGRQKSRITDQLNMKYNLINTYMNFMSLDYQDAEKRYDQEYKQNLDIYNIITGAEKQARSEFEADRAAATANLGVFTNLITKGNLDMSKLPPEQGAMITKLEVQAGLPIGTMAAIKKDPNSDIITTTSNNGKIQVLIRNADGSMSLQSYGSSSNGKGYDFKPPKDVQSSTDPAADAIWKKLNA